MKFFSVPVLVGLALGVIPVAGPVGGAQAEEASVPLPTQRPATSGAAIAAATISGTKSSVAASKPGNTIAKSESAPAPATLDRLATLTVNQSEIDDIKSVYATVRSTDRIEARARIGGTVATLTVDEGSEVETGQVIAIVADQKLALKLKALTAQIAGLKSQFANVQKELGRQEELIKRGFTPKAKVDEISTQVEVVQNQLKSAEAERDVVTRQVQEGEVLAPASGRVLLVPVTAGSVIMPGESLATIAANEYVLRLELPERHARFMRKGDSIKVGSRSLGADTKKLVKGAITQVYPELQSGRVVADATVLGLGDYFVGERVLVYISGGKRQGLVIPRSYLTTRYGYDFVKVVRTGGMLSDVVVQLGNDVELADGASGVEVLGGLNSGDEIVLP